LGLAIRTAAPINDLGLVHVVALGVGCRETRSETGRAIDIDDTAATSTDQMVVVVAHAIFEARGRAGGLNAADETFDHQDAKSVVHRLERDGPDVGPDDLGHTVRRDMGLSRDRAQHRQSLRGDLQTALAKEVSRVGCHVDRLAQFLGIIQIFDRLRVTRMSITWLQGQREMRDAIESVLRDAACADAGSRYWTEKF